jgi:hypothetical protein
MDQRPGFVEGRVAGVRIDPERYIPRAAVFTRRKILRAGTRLSRACPRRWKREMTQNRDE